MFATKWFGFFRCVEKLENIAASSSCVLQDIPQGDLKETYVLGATFQIIFHCIHHPYFNWAPIDYQLFLDFPPPSTLLLSPRRSFVLVPSRPLSHQETHVIRTEGFQNIAPSSVSCSFQFSCEIHINIFWSQDFPILQPSPSHFRPCDDCSFSHIPSSTFLFATFLLPLTGGVEFCKGVGGVILLLVMRRL